MPFAIKLFAERLLRCRDSHRRCRRIGRRRLLRRRGLFTSCWRCRNERYGRWYGDVGCGGCGERKFGGRSLRLCSFLVVHPDVASKDVGSREARIACSAAERSSAGLICRVSRPGQMIFAKGRNPKASRVSSRFARQCRRAYSAREKTCPHCRWFGRVSQRRLERGLMRRERRRTVGQACSCLDGGAFRFDPSACIVSASTLTCLASHERTCR